MKDIKLYTQKEFLELPTRTWSRTTVYDSIVIVNSKIIHDSGFGMMAVIGCNFSEDGEEIIPKEIAAMCDHVWFFDQGEQWEVIKNTGFSFDMLPRSKCVRVFAWDKKIEVGASLSSAKLRWVEGKTAKKI